jgi:hypothetical protein
MESCLKLKYSANPRIPQLKTLELESIEFPIHQATTMAEPELRCRVLTADRSLLVSILAAPRIRSSRYFDNPAPLSELGCGTRLSERRDEIDRNVSIDPTILSSSSSQTSLVKYCISPEQ